MISSVEGRERVSSAEGGRSIGGGGGHSVGRGGDYIGGGGMHTMDDSFYFIFSLSVI